MSKKTYTISLDRLGSFFNTLLDVGAHYVSKLRKLFGDTSNPVGSWIAKTTGTALTGAEREANQFNAEEAQKQRDWQTEMDNTKYQRQVADMQSAGVNPALLYGSGSSPSSVPSGSSASSVSPASASFEVLPMLLNYFLSSRKLGLESRSLDIAQQNADSNTVRAEADRLRSDNDTIRVSLERSRLKIYQENMDEVTRGLKISNDVDEALMEIRKLQAERNLQLTESQIANIDESTKLVTEQISYYSELCKTEPYKRALLASQKRLSEADLQTKTTFNLYADTLYRAESESAKTKAQNDLLEYTYNSGILSEEMMDLAIDEAKARYKVSVSSANYAELRSDLLNNRFRPDKYKGKISVEDWYHLRQTILDPYVWSDGIQANPNVATKK